MNLSKGQSINLAKSGESVVFKIGASWSASTNKKSQKGFFGKLFGCGENEEVQKSIDLDLASFSINNDNKVYHECSWRKNRVDYMKTSGDDLHGGGSEDKDNETITIKVKSIPDDVNKIMLVIDSYSQIDFDLISNAKVRVYEGESDNPTKTHCVYNVASDSTFKGSKTLVIGCIEKEGDSWSFRAIGDVRKYYQLDKFINEYNNGVTEW